MRKPEYISPTSYMLWRSDREGWYKQYGSPYKIPRPPQTPPMSVGSAFDAYVKSELHQILYPDANDPQFVFQTLFEKQVEAHVREEALEAGKHCFDEYKRLGAFDDLLASMKHENSRAKFESDVQGPVGPVILMGKPDAWFFNKAGHPIILDWKVNGYYGKGNKSPEKGYYRLRGDAKGKDQHKDCFPVDFKGTMINGAIHMENVSRDWATQISIYAWLCGAPIGSEFICAIDQLACSGNDGGKPSIRVAEHRCTVSSDFQKELYAGLCKMWDSIQREHVFDDQSFSDSQELQRHLDDENMCQFKLLTSDKQEDKELVDFLGFNQYKPKF